MSKCRGKMVMVEAEKDKLQDQRLQTLAEAAHMVNTEDEILIIENGDATRYAEYTRKEVEEEHQKELEQKAMQSADDHAKGVLELKTKLQDSKDSLQKVGKDLEHSQRRLQEEKSRNQDLNEKFEAEKQEIQWQLHEATEDLEFCNGTITALMCQQRTANDELEDARKTCLEVLQRMDHPNLRIKRMGELKTAPRTMAGKEKYKDHKCGWEEVLLHDFLKRGHHNVAALGSSDAFTVIQSDFVLRLVDSFELGCASSSLIFCKDSAWLREA